MHDVAINSFQSFLVAAAFGFIPTFVAIVAGDWMHKGLDPKFPGSLFLGVFFGSLVLAGCAIAAAVAAHYYYGLVTPESVRHAIIAGAGLALIPGVIWSITFKLDRYPDC